ncbi:MAG: GIY-YIG nuclease family protein [Pseudomonadota bacterium]
MSESWFVYLLRCADESLYAGITTDLERRLLEHNEHPGLGAKYTRGRRPVRLVYQEACVDRAQAARREAQLKRMRKAAKERLLSAGGCR